MKNRPDEHERHMNMGFSPRGPAKDLEWGQPRAVEHGAIGTPHHQMIDSRVTPTSPTSLEAALLQFAVLVRLEDGQSMSLGEIASGIGNALGLVSSGHADLAAALADLVA